MKRKAVQLIAHVVVAEGLSTQARTKSGVLFDATADIWSYRDGTMSVHLDFRQLRGLIEPLNFGTKLLMQSLAANGSAASLCTCFRVWLNFITYLHPSTGPLAQIRGLDFLNYRASTRGGTYAGHIKTLLRRWHKLGVSGLAPDVLSTLQDTKGTSRAKGVAVATMDPVEGPLTDIELQAVQEALNEAYATSAVDTSDWVLAWLFMALGSRPAQFAALKVKDVHVRSVEGAVDYSIDVPRAKQRSLSRTEFKNRPLVRQIGDILARYVNGVREAFEGGNNNQLWISN